MRRVLYQVRSQLIHKTKFWCSASTRRVRHLAFDLANLIKKGHRVDGETVCHFDKRNAEETDLGMRLEAAETVDVGLLELQLEDLNGRMRRLECDHARRQVDTLAYMSGLLELSERIRETSEALRRHSEQARVRQQSVSGGLSYDYRPADMTVRSV